MKVKKTFGIGDLVEVPIGTSTLKGKIAEDRGNIGVRGRKLYRIVVKIDGEVINIELPEDQIQRAAIVAKVLKKIKKKPKTI